MRHPSRMLQWTRAIGKSFVDLVYPPICLHCHEPLEDSSALFCQCCMLLLSPIDPAERCPYCFSSEFDPENDVSCRECRKERHPCDRMAAVFDYEGPASTLIKRLKYGGQFYLATGAGAFLTAQWIALDWPMPDCIVPMPMARLRKFERGYNQSRLLADVIGGLLKCPVLDVLKRRTGDFSQGGLNYSQRMQLNSAMFTMKGRPNLYDKKILLIDDVMTTGSSLRCCAEVLRGGCPDSIYALTLCRALD